MKENMGSRSMENSGSEYENNYFVFDDKKREAMRRILENARDNRPEDDTVNDDFYNDISEYLKKDEMRRILENTKYNNFRHNAHNHEFQFRSNRRILNFHNFHSNTYFHDRRVGRNIRNNRRYH